MKIIKTALLAISLMGAAQNIEAQEVYDIVEKSAQSVINNPNANDFDLKVNQFKLTALHYVRNKGIKLHGGIQSDMLDMQAYCLNVFLTDYLTALKKATAAERKNVIMVFVNATRKYPLYDDKDRETTEAFVKDPGGFTPFSINVNWEKAMEDEQAALKK